LLSYDRVTSCLASWSASNRTKCRSYAHEQNLYPLSSSIASGFLEKRVNRKAAEWWVAEWITRHPPSAYRPSFPEDDDQSPQCPHNERSHRCDRQCKSQFQLSPKPLANRL